MSKYLDICHKVWPRKEILWPAGFVAASINMEVVSMDFALCNINCQQCYPHNSLFLWFNEGSRPRRIKDNGLKGYLFEEGFDSCCLFQLRTIFF